MQECWEERKDGKDVKLRDTHKLRRVHVIPVTKLVCQNGLHLLRLALLDECVEDDDVLALRI